MLEKGGARVAQWSEERKAAHRACTLVLPFELSVTVTPRCTQGFNTSGNLYIRGSGKQIRLGTCNSTQRGVLLLCFLEGVKYHTRSGGSEQPTHCHHLDAMQ